MKILVIDDEDEIRDVIRRSLELDKHEVLEAENGVHALEVIQANRPDLIISDVNMPRMGGVELFETLRAGTISLNLISFIFISGNATEEEQIERLSNGAVHCMQKPISMKLLRAHVKSFEWSLKKFSRFTAHKLDEIVENVPLTINREFKQFRSLVENLDNYAENIASMIKAYIADQSNNLYLHSPNGSAESEAVRDASVLRKSRLGVIQFHLDELHARNSLLARSGKGFLPWQLIFLVAEADLSQKDLYVSDLYVSANGAKTTINNHINGLLEDRIFEKRSVAEDGRRQKITLSKSFARKFFNHVDEFSDIALIAIGGRNRMASQYGD